RLVLAVLACAACGIDATGTAATDIAPAEPAPAPDDRSPGGSTNDPAPAPSPWDLDPPCDRAPCAARPIVFVHGHRGSNSDWADVTNTLLKDDPRWDEVHFAGTKDHAAWTTRSIGRRGWLFVFDYYVERGNDARESYTAGHGRVGSRGGIIADTSDYDHAQHEYGEDLGALVDDILRAT